MRWLIMGLVFSAACGTGQSPDAKKEWAKDMWYAIQGDRLDEVKRILAEHPEWIDLARDDRGASPLYYSMAYSKLGPDIAEYLLAQGADPNNQDKENGATLLHQAIYNDRFDFLELLMDSGADPFLKDAKGRTPLALAEFYGGASAHMAEALTDYEQQYE